MEPPASGIADDEIRIRMPSITDAPLLQRHASTHGGLDGVWVPLAHGATREACEVLIGDWLAGWQNRPSRHGPAFLVDQVGAAKAIGYAGLRDRGDRVVELVYGIAPEFRGRGYASRAVRLASGWLISAGLAREVELRIGDAHPESRRVAEKAGFALAGRVVSQVVGIDGAYHDLRFVTTAVLREEPLQGGRVTDGVVRVGDTVRRPAGGHSLFVSDLLEHLARSGFDGAPLGLGVDEKGRDVLSFIPGEVPRELGFYSDDQLASAFVLLRRFHDSTAGSRIARGAEVVCHGDFSPCNTVFRDGVPVALIDFDTAARGRRVEDVAYGLFLWLELGNEEIAFHEQRRRLEISAAAYGTRINASLLGEIARQVARTAERRRGRARESAAWWQDMHGWLLSHTTELAR